MSLVHALALACALISTLVSQPAHAHRVGISSGDYRASGTTVELAATFARSELAAVLSEADSAAPERELTLLERSRISSWARAGFSVTSGGDPCASRLRALDLTEQDGVAVRLVFECAGPADRAEVDVSLLAQLTPGHRHIVHVISGGGATDLVLRAEARTFALDVVAPLPDEHRDNALPRRPSRGGGLFSSALGLGVEHILTGYDHLLFLAGLLLARGPLRQLVAAITTFTVAHSVTLALAGLGVVGPHPRVVEPLIALSIVYVGIENWFVTTAPHRWRLTFSFGLVHGLGFAGALREVALPGAALWSSLGGFNLGVEVGQIAVLGVTLPLLLLARARGWWSDRAAKALSLAIAAIGAVWFCVRVASP